MDRLELYAVGALAIVGLVIYWDLRSGVKGAAVAVGTGAKAAANAVNPVNNNNIINQGANALLGHDNKTSSIGTSFFDWMNPDQPVAVNGPLKVVTPAATRKTK